MRQADATFLHGFRRIMGLAGSVDIRSRRNPLPWHENRTKIGNKRRPDRPSRPCDPSVSWWLALAPPGAPRACWRPPMVDPTAVRQATFLAAPEPVPAAAVPEWDALEAAIQKS